MWICDLHKNGMTRDSFLPPKAIRELREISRYYHKLIGKNSSESCRCQNCMTVSNIGLASAFSDVNGKTGKSIMKELLKSDEINEKKSSV